jgi:hypothetical protein
MTVLFLIVAWFALSIPVAMLAGRFLRTSSRHDVALLRAVQAAAGSGGAHRRAG